MRLLRQFLPEQMATLSWPESGPRSVPIFRAHEGICDLIGDDCLGSVPGIWPHFVGPFFFRKSRGPGVKKNTRHVAHLMHQEMNSFSCEVHTGGGVEDGTRDGNFRKSSHQRRSPGSCLTAPMYRPRSRQHSEAVTASSVADSSMFASRSGAPFPRSGQRLEASIV